ncbi:hypothetical protein [Nocardiopsis nanhaiensis]
MHSPTSEQQAWLDLRGIRRGLWGVGLVAAVLTFAISLTTLLASAGAEFEDLLRNAVVCAAALVVVLVLLWSLPRALTAQGIAVGPEGVDFIQRPLWWFRGRKLSVPWRKSRGFRFEPPPNTRGTVVGEGSIQHFTAYLYRTPPAHVLPSWLSLIPEGAGGADFPQVRIPLAPEQRRPLVEALSTHCPEGLFEGGSAVRPQPRQAHPIPPGTHTQPGPPAPSGHTPPGHAGHPVPPSDTSAPAPVPPPPTRPEPGTGPQHPAVTGFVSARERRIRTWRYGFLAATGAFVLTGLLPLRMVLDDITAGRDRILAAELVLPLLGIGAAALVVMCVLVAYLPQFSTVQGVQVGPNGISVLKERRWWFRGHQAFVAWHDIHHIASSSRSNGERHRGIAEVHLHRADHEMRLPRWAPLVMAGRNRWGCSAPRPLLLIDMLTPARARELFELLRRARPDLLDAAVAERADTQRWSGPEARQPVQTPDRFAPDPAWVDVRPRRALGWAFALFIAGSGTWQGARVAAADLAGTGPGAPIPFYVLSTALLLLLWAGVCWSAPRFFTVQGASVDNAGITLVQEPLLWFEGRTLFLSWDDVRMARTASVRGTKANSEKKVVLIFLHGPDMVTHTPTWCTFSPYEDTESPASVEHPLTRITVSIGWNTGALATALRGMRPDLVPM